MTRQAEIKPATAYDYRHSIELVEALATGDDNNLRALCMEWGTFVYKAMDDHIDYSTTIHKLARAAIERDRAE